MKIVLNKFKANHRNNNCKLSMIFHMTTITRTAAKVTAAIIIFMQAIISVSTTKTGSHIRTEMDITATTTTVTWTKTLLDLSKNPIIAQQSPKLLTKTQTQTPPLQPTALKASSTLSSYHVPDATKIMTHPKASSSETSTLVISEGDCKSLSAEWGDIDPNIFYICNAQTKRSLQLRCPKGKGFFLGLGYSGCIPYEQWPACISSGHVEQVAICDSEHMQQPWQSKNPNKFYICLKEATKPTILNCESGKGFVHAVVTTSTSVGSGGNGTRAVNGVGRGSATATARASTSKIVGCANWEKWRNYMHCNDFY